MLAAEVEGDAAALVAGARERGLLVNSTGPTTLRLVPPLILTRAEADEAVTILAQALAG
jgi:4-aminobutyrate aminotransferase-like enzyme